MRIWILQGVWVLSGDRHCFAIISVQSRIQMVEYLLFTHEPYSAGYAWLLHDHQIFSLPSLCNYLFGETQLSFFKSDANRTIF